MKVSIYDVICELNRRKVTVNNLKDMTDEGLINLLPEAEIPTTKVVTYKNNSTETI